MGNFTLIDLNRWNITMNWIYQKVNTKNKPNQANIHLEQKSSKVKIRIKTLIQTCIILRNKKTEAIKWIIKPNNPHKRVIKIHKTKTHQTHQMKIPNRVKI